MIPKALGLHGFVMASLGMILGFSGVVLSIIKINSIHDPGMYFAVFLITSGCFCILRAIQVMPSDSELQKLENEKQ